MRDLMSHWDDTLLGKVPRTRRAAIIRDLETNVRGPLDPEGCDLLRRFEPRLKSSSNLARAAAGNTGAMPMNFAGKSIE